MSYNVFVFSGKRTDCPRTTNGSQIRTGTGLDAMSYLTQLTFDVKIHVHRNLKLYASPRVNWSSCTSRTLNVVQQSSGINSSNKTVYNESNPCFLT
jgi:hypothetical protein